MINKDKFTQEQLEEAPYTPSVETQTDRFLTNFRGGNRLQRGGGWALKGGGSNTASFGSFSAGTIAADQTPSQNNAYALGNPSFKWSNIATVLINGVTPKSGSVTYYVSNSNGGAVNQAITFNTGILT